MSAASKANEPSMEEILASIRRIIADDAGPKEPPKPAPAEPTRDDSDILDLATLQPAAPEPEAPPPMPGDAAGPDDIEFREIAQDFAPEPEPEPVYAPELPRAPAPEPVPPPPPAPAAVQSHGLLSPEADASVARAFGSLGSLAMPQSGRTLEDLMADLLRPMLKGWLDENLPPLVERLVRAEIERVSRLPRG